MSSFDVRISLRDEFNFFFDTFQTFELSLDITNVFDEIQNIAFNNFVVEQRREMLIIQHNISFLITIKMMSSQNSKIDSLNKLKISNIEKNNFVDVMRYHEHRRRYRRFRNVTSFHKRKIANRHKTFFDRRISMRSNEKSINEFEKFRNRRRKKIRKIKRQTFETSTRNLNHFRTIFSFKRTNKFRNKRIRKHKRERRKKQKCLSKFITFFRKVLHIEITYFIRFKSK